MLRAGRDQVLRRLCAGLGGREIRAFQVDSKKVGHVLFDRAGLLVGLKKRDVYKRQELPSEEVSLFSAVPPVFCLSLIHI